MMFLIWLHVELLYWKFLLWRAKRLQAKITRLQTKVLNRQAWVAHKLAERQR